MKIVIKILLLFLLPLSYLEASDQQELQQLKEQVVQILKRIEILEAKERLRVENGSKKAQNNLLKSDEKPLVKVAKTKKKVEETETVSTVGGRIQLDTLLTSPKGSHYVKSIPLDGKVNNNNDLTSHARNSRLWYKTRTPSKYGMIKTLIEVDFKGSKGSEINKNEHGIGLRYAYANIGNWSVGQANSSFTTHTYLDMFHDPINEVFARQPLVRYSIDKGDFVYDLSFEQPETTLLDPDGNIIAIKDDLLPDIVARLRYYPDWGEMGFSVMGRYINQDHARISVDGSSKNLSSNDSAFALAANLSAKMILFRKDDIRFALHYGNGLGRYIAYNSYAAGSIDADGNIVLQPSYGGHIGYRHWWSNTLRSTLSYSFTGTDNKLSHLSSSADLSSINEEAHSSQINLIWVPAPNSLVGLEYIKAKREVASEEHGWLDTAMLRFRYDF